MLNDDVDYAAFYRNAARAMRHAVEALYDAAGASLERDLDGVNATARMPPSEHAQAFWGQRGRTVFGDPAIPVFRMRRVGDYQVPYSLALGYAEALSLQGRSDAARIAFVSRTGHCNFTEAETATAVAVLVRRIETGVWPIGRYNRLWLPRPGA